LKDLKEFDIDLVSLANESHDFQYIVNDKFFTMFEHSLVEVGNCSIRAVLTKSETMLICEFDINGTIQLTCDRSLELFDYQIATVEQIIFKYGEQAQELSDEIVIIPRGLATLNLAQYIYEFITLCVPMKKLHPRFVSEAEDESEEEAFLIYSSAETEQEVSKEETDPRWEDLKKLIK
jgi:uncharacterized metal-binding protein YceD (DUF177 family)